ncbi:hypothetical protein MNEG_3536 [Monoraphidium neglectum]|uniref:Uncharacterized protein n=1 Tax=Monoraphidium neglectum TaxID=145388 RepID=A0A0D2MP02_9CHLO|nr:hypothetical protein MNEG_3536 [Monoraphidium neglectum]KIZ04425.1 hypothetical protein MNEG_3536 [Monoraphidium neglectum]|eukprot:XP_013903444.1 hypothetical protein MNEG_3536 [Monoraphidium neglectum]
MVKPSISIFNVSTVALCAITFCVWAITLSSLAGLQQTCENIPEASIGGSATHNAGGLVGVRGFSAKFQTCTELFGYYWWIVIFELALLASLAGALYAGCTEKVRTPLVGVLVVVSSLWFQMTDSFLALEGVGNYADGQPLHRARTMGAGCVATGLLNLLMIVAIGSDFDAWPKDNFNAHVDEGGCQAGQAQGPGRTGAAVA